jgi:alpha-glucosidase (family GH31 glycosyl hydrolase)
VDIYRKFVLLHHDLKEFFLTAGSYAYSKGKSVMQPITKDKKVIELTNEHNLGYVLWFSFLVAPIFDESGFAEVVFPKGSSWIYYFNRSRIFEGGVTRNMGVKLDEAAFFIRSNTIIPFKKQLWLVYLKEGKYEMRVMGGKYND